MVEYFTKMENISHLSIEETEDLYFALMRLPSTPINTMMLDKCEKNYWILTKKSLTKTIRKRLNY